MPEIITYETIYELLRREKTRQELQKLDINIFQQVNQYLKEKSSLIESQKEKSPLFTTEVEKTQHLLDNIKLMVKELYERRERKILDLALLASRAQKIPQNTKSNMLPNEIKLYESIINTLKESKTDTILNNQQQITKKSSEESNILLKFLLPTPKFVGTDNFIYGPFDKEEIASLPSLIAKVLLDKKKVEKLQYET